MQRSIGDRSGLREDQLLSVCSSPCDDENEGGPHKYRYHHQDHPRVVLVVMVAVLVVILVVLVVVLVVLLVVIGELPLLQLHLQCHC